MTSEKTPYTILAVDDPPANIDIVKGILADKYFVQIATLKSKIWI